MPVIQKLKKIRDGERPCAEAVRKTARYVKDTQKELRKLGVEDKVTSREMWIYFEEQMKLWAEEVEENSRELVRKAFREHKERVQQSEAHMKHWALSTFRRLFVCLFVLMLVSLFVCFCVAVYLFVCLFVCLFVWLQAL
jgi:hypothetical protein